MAEQVNVILRCSGCKDKKRVAIDKDYEKDPSGRTQRQRAFYSYKGKRLDGYRGEIMYNKTNHTFEMTCSDACQKKGKVFLGKAVEGHTNDTPCNKKCTDASGHLCECSCGGANHGGRWAV